MLLWVWPGDSAAINNPSVFSALPASATCSSGPGQTPAEMLARRRRKVRWRRRRRSHEWREAENGRGRERKRYREREKVL